MLGVLCSLALLYMPSLLFEDLGCFSDVDIRIDTATGGGPADYEVTFLVRELGRARGTVNTMVGNQEGSLLTGLAAPNLLGRGERLQVRLATLNGKSVTAVNGYEASCTS